MTRRELAFMGPVPSKNMYLCYQNTPTRPHPYCNFQTRISYGLGPGACAHKAKRSSLARKYSKGGDSCVYSRKLSGAPSYVRLKTCYLSSCNSSGRYDFFTVRDGLNFRPMKALLALKQCRCSICVATRALRLTGALRRIIGCILFVHVHTGGTHA